jgi:hypothetical protein
MVLWGCANEQLTPRRALKLLVSESHDAAFSGLANLMLIASAIRPHCMEQRMRWRAFLEVGSRHGWVLCVLDAGVPRHADEWSAFFR